MSNPAGLRRILELARWAPSGDNTQPWRFQIAGENHVVVHGADTREHCVYDLDGHPSQIAWGALLETAAVAASAQGLRMQAQRRPESPDTHPVFDLRFSEAPDVRPDPLLASIEKRSVQRRPLSTRALTAPEKAQMEAALGSGHRLLWQEGFGTRLQIALLMFRSARLRLIMPEAYQVHKDIIEWNQQFSETRVPDQALGSDAMTTKLMRFVMGSWRRVEFFNRFLAGTWAPRIQLDFLPSLGCAAHFVLLAQKAPSSFDDYVAAGRAMQRLWLTVTHLGLQMQPEVTPLIFSRYARERRNFSRLGHLHELAADIGQRLAKQIGADAAAHAVFMGRVGAGPAAQARSLRRPLEQLLIPNDASKLRG